MVQTQGHNRLTVLLANEQEEWHQTVRGLLEPQGVQTLVARSGREALDLIESRPIHVAVLDQQMPQLGGLQVIKLMRERLRDGLRSPESRSLEARPHESGSSTEPRQTPTAILLASQLTNHLLHEALGMHVFTVLAKPVDFNLLLDSLARVLKRYHESRWPGEGN